MKCQPITGGEREVSANHRRGARSVSQSHEGSEKCLSGYRYYNSESVYVLPSTSFKLE
jgi:hypothetical protein